MLGIKENVKEKNYSVQGVDVPEDVIKQLFNENNNKNKINKPFIAPDDVLSYKFQGKIIIRINVHKATNEERPIYLNNRKDNCFVRTDDGDRLATEEQYKFFIVDSQREVDTELLENYDIDDLNLEDIHSYKEILARNTNNDLTFIRIWKIDALSILKEDDNLDHNEEIILRFAEENTIFKFQDARELIGPKFKNEYTLRKSINSLIKKNIILSNRHGRATTYKLNMSDTQNTVESIRMFKKFEDMIYRNV